MGVGDVSCTWSQGLTLFSGPPGEAEEGAGVRRSLGLLRARSLGTGGPWPGGLEKSGSGVLLNKEEGPGKKRLDTRCVGNPQDHRPMPGPPPDARTTGTRRAINSKRDGVHPRKGTRCDPPLPGRWCAR